MDHCEDRFKDDKEDQWTNKKMLKEDHWTNEKTLKKNTKRITKEIPVSKASKSRTDSPNTRTTSPIRI